MVNEELTKSEVKNMIDSQIENFTKENNFKKKVKEIVVDVIDDFFQQMWQKKSFWKSNLKNG